MTGFLPVFRVSRETFAPCRGLTITDSVAVTTVAELSSCEGSAGAQSRSWGLGETKIARDFATTLRSNDASIIVNWTEHPPGPTHFLVDSFSLTF